MHDNRISVSSGRRLFSLGIMGVMAALALGAVMSLGGPRPVSATTGTGYDEGHFDLVAEVDCDGGTVSALNVFIHGEVEEEEVDFEPGDYFIFNEGVGPEVGFELEYVDTNGCGGVEIELKKAWVPDPGFVEADFSFWSLPSDLFQAQDPNDVTEHGPLTLPSGLNFHVDPEWNFAGDGWYVLKFKVTATGATPQYGWLVFNVTGSTF